MKTILGAYIVVQILILSSLMILEFSLLLHIIFMITAGIAYFMVSFKNPGYYKGVQTSIVTLENQVKPKKRPSIDQMIIKEEIQEEDLQQSINDEIQQISKKIQQKIKIQNQLNKVQNQLLTKKSQQNHIIISTKIAQNVQKTPLQDFMIGKKGKQTIRYCRICKVIQPYRVRHCHQCQKCICTFDHHCPWMDNCIGEKNRNTFWVYLFIQMMQFLMILIEISTKTLMTNEQKLKLYFFAALILLLTTTVFFMLVFHTFLMVKNLTTWEFVKWDKITYLSIYPNKSSSPFSFGLISNLKDYFFPNKQPKEWIINPKFIQNCQQIKTKSKQVQNQNKIAKPQPELKNKEKPKFKTEKVVISHYLQ